MKKIQASKFMEKDPEAESSVSDDSGSDDDSSVTDLDKPLAINKPVNRLNNKTQAQRNRDIEARDKARKVHDLKAKKKFDKDLDRLDNLLK